MEKDEYICGNDARQVMWYNFLMLLTIRVQFSYGDNSYYKVYLEIAKIGNSNNIIPSNLGREHSLLIKDDQFYNALLPILSEHK